MKSTVWKYPKPKLYACSRTSLYFRPSHSHLSAHIRVEEDWVDQLFNRAKSAFARILLLLANFGKEGGPQPLSARLPRIRWRRWLDDQVHG